MPKKDRVLTALGDSPERWDRYLAKTYGLPQEPSTRKEVQQDCIRAIDPTWIKRPKPVTLDEAGESATQATDALLSLHQESAVNGDVVLSPAWTHYLAYMDVIAEALSPADRGAALKQLALMDARSRHWEHPPDSFHSIDMTPAEFRERWACGELDIRARRASSRSKFVIEIRQYNIPLDDEPDYEDDGGHWDGLKWTPTED